jgi:hypothetical protein
MRRLLLWVLLVGPGCFDGRVEPDVKLTCAAISDCPAGFVCALALSPPACVAAESDNVAPVLSGLFVTPLSGPDDLVEACVDSNESPAFGRFSLGAQVVDATINGLRLCSAIAASRLGEGVHGVQVRVVDLAGNATEVGLGTTVVDLTPPEVRLGALLGQANIAAVGDEVAIVISATEPLAGEATLRWSGALTGERIIDLTSTTSTTIDLTGAGDGVLGLSLEGARDLAGNIAGVASNSFIVDASPPVIGAVTVPDRVSRVAGFDEITVTAEIVDADTVELLIGLDVIGCRRAQNDTFVCEATVGDVGLPPGPGTLAIQARDAAGNTAERFLVITLDEEGPAVAAMQLTLPAHPIHPQRTRAPLGGQATLTLTLDELSLEPPTLLASRGIVTCAASASRQVFVCTWQAPSAAVAGDPDEQGVTFSVAAIDTVGNTRLTAGLVPSPALVLDARATPPPVDTGVVVVTRQQDGAIILEETPPGTWEPGAFIVIRGPSGAVTGSFVIESTGASSARPLGSVFEPLTVEQLDAAGNTSQALSVRRYRTRADVTVDANVIGELGVTFASPPAQQVLSATIDPTSGHLVFVEQFENGCRLEGRLCRTSPAGTTCVPTSTVRSVAGVAGEGVFAAVGTEVALFQVGQDLAMTPIAAPPGCTGFNTLVGSADGQAALLRCGSASFERVAGAWNALPGTDTLSFAPDGRLERFVNARRIRLDDGVDVGPLPCPFPSGRVPLPDAEAWFCGGTTSIVRGEAVVEVDTPDRTDDLSGASYVTDGSCALRVGGVQVNNCFFDCGTCGFGEDRPVGSSRRLCVQDVPVAAANTTTLSLPFGGVPVATTLAFVGEAAVASTTAAGAPNPAGTLQLSTFPSTESPTIPLDGEDDVAGELVLPPTRSANVAAAVRATAGTGHVASLSTTLTLTLTVDLAP